MITPDGACFIAFIIMLIVSCVYIAYDSNK